MPRDWDYHERRGAPLVGLLVAVVVLALGAAFASMDVRDGAVECGTAMSPRDPVGASASIEPGTTLTELGKTGCDKAITNRRLLIGVGVVLGLGVAVYFAVSSSGARGIGAP